MDFDAVAKYAGSIVSFAAVAAIGAGVYNIADPGGRFKIRAYPERNGPEEPASVFAVTAATVITAASVNAAMMLDALARTNSNVVTVSTRKHSMQLHGRFNSNKLRDH
jgi:hypothetical protein